jgi:SAM-dependent methyltransferase
MTRKKFLLSLFDTTGLGLEIGPSFNPLLPKKDGYNVEILDHLNDQDLIKKYENAAGADISKIESVDYVSSGSSIYDAIGKAQRFDYIFASHVIEHTVDFVGFFQDCERLLKPEGVLVLVVPDKRYSFDALRPLSSTGDVLQGHIDRRTNHSPGKVFDEIAYNSLREGALAWSASSDGDLRFFSQLDEAKSVFEATQQDGLFRDIHAWQFTPSSFRLIVNDLFEIGCIGLRELKFREGNGEFYSVFTRSGAGPQVSRMYLAQQSIAEQYSIIVGDSETFLNERGKPPLMKRLMSAVFGS